MGAESAGVLLFRRREGALEVLLAHPGGPFWAKKDDGVWSIPKGLREASEDLLVAARREFHEETGFAPEGAFLSLGSVRQRSGKTVHAFAIEGELDPARLVSNTCKVEWPPRSKKIIVIPEIDRAAWFNLSLARTKMIEAQTAFLDRLANAFG